MPHSGAIAQSKTDTRPLPYFFSSLNDQTFKFDYKIDTLIALLTENESFNEVLNYIVINLSIN